MATIKLLSVIEATTVTGPARVLLEFYGSAGGLQPPVETCIATFHRTDGEPHDHAKSAPNRFVQVAREAGLRVEVIDERRRFDNAVLPALSEIVRHFAPDIIESVFLTFELCLYVWCAVKLRPWPSDVTREPEKAGIS